MNSEEETQNNTTKEEYKKYAGTSAGVTGLSRDVSDKVVFVDNLASTVSRERFIELFLPYARSGKLKDFKFLRHKTGAETCYGFVEFENEEDGKRAIAELNWKLLDGRNIRVSRAKPPSTRVSDTNLYVEGVPLEWTDMDLCEFFSKFCSISEARVLVNRNAEGAPKSRGVGFVHCVNNEQARLAIEAIKDKANLPVENIQVKFAKRAKTFKRPNRGRGGTGPSFGGRGKPLNRSHFQQ